MPWCMCTRLHLDDRRVDGRLLSARWAKVESFFWQRGNFKGPLSSMVARSDTTRRRPLGYARREILLEQALHCGRFKGKHLNAKSLLFRPICLQIRSGTRSPASKRVRRRMINQSVFGIAYNAAHSTYADVCWFRLLRLGGSSCRMFFRANHPVETHQVIMAECSTFVQPGT